MKIQIDGNRCQGTAMCLAVAPHVFTITPSGIAESLIEDAEGEIITAVEDAADACPVAAIRLVKEA